jgi:hypothetical protein
VNTLKSAAVLGVLLFVLYAVYVAISKPEIPLGGPMSESEVAPPLIEGGQEGYSTSGGAGTRSWQSGAGATTGHSAYPSNLDTGHMPPPTMTPTAPELARSAYETSAVAPSAYVSPSSQSSQAPPLEPLAAAPIDAPVVSASTSPALAAYDLRRDMTEAEQLVAQGNFRAALAKLTPHYASEGLAIEQRTLLYSWLDALAGKVIYSREHLMSPAHQVRKGETLFDVAHQYNVEYRLLQNINSREVSDPLILVPATELKVVPGPFHADANLATGEVTMLVGDLYAGRFPFVLGDQPPGVGD